jgi:hypothetical protein
MSEKERYSSIRERSYAFIQETVAEDPDLEGAVLLGFMVVAEWQAPNGGRWLSKVSGDSAKTLPPWRERMLGFEVAHEWWASEGADEEEDDASP